MKECEKFDFEKDSDLKISCTERRLLAETFTKRELSGKKETYQDRIYGQCYIHPLVAELKNTKLFNRLKSIQQLGNTHHLYTGGNGKPSFFIDSS